MGAFLGYVFIMVVVFFFFKKALWQNVKDWAANKSSNVWIESHYFWLIVLATAFWPLSLPIIALWALLEYAYNKFNKPKDSKESEEIN